MKRKKLLVFIFIFILILPSISLTVSSQEGNDKKSLQYRISKLLFRSGWLPTFKAGRFFIYQLRVPIAIQPYPETVSLKYLNETTFVIGGLNREETDWAPLVDVAAGFSYAWMNKKIKYSFEFVVPENTSEDIWNVIFDPNELICYPNKKNLNWPGWDTPFKTNMTVMLKPGIDPKTVTQDVVLKVNIISEQVIDKVGLMFIPPYAWRGDTTEFEKRLEEIGEPNLLKRDFSGIFFQPSGFLYTPFAVPVALRRSVLPNIDIWVDSTVEILIKVDKFHLADIEPIPLQEIQPFEVKSIPITIKNIGSHIDTYNFNVRCDDKNMVVTAPPALTLRPGETGNALVGVGAPRDFLSIGATTSIFVDAYSIDDPETVFSNTIILQTKGIHTTGSPTINAALLIISLIIIVYLFFYFSRKIRDKICTKPDKPWDIPEEKKNLEKLKEKNKDKYNKTLKMMHNEYDSSLLWYKYYVDSIIRKKKVAKSKQREEIRKVKEKEKLKKLEIKKEEKRKEAAKKVKEKKEEKKLTKKEEPKPKPLAKKEERLEKKVEEKPVVKPVIVDKKTIDTKSKKYLILQKIKHEQNKQKKKFGKYT